MTFVKLVRKCYRLYCFKKSIHLFCDLLTGGRPTLILITSGKPLPLGKL